MSRLRHYWPTTTRRLATIAIIEMILGVAYATAQVFHV